MPRFWDNLGSTKLRFVVKRMILVCQENSSGLYSIFAAFPGDFGMQCQPGSVGGMEELCPTTEKIPCSPQAFKAGQGTGMGGKLKLLFLPGISGSCEFPVIPAKCPKEKGCAHPKRGRVASQIPHPTSQSRRGIDQLQNAQNTERGRELKVYPGFFQL